MNFRQVLMTSPAQMSIAFDSLKVEQIQEFEQEASALAQRAAWVSEYLSLRGGAGCGDHGHDRAVAEAHKRVKRVRRALGYTQP